MRQFLILLAALAFLGAPAASAQTAGPELIVVSPQNDAVVNGSTLEVTFQANSFSIIPSTVPLAEAGKRPDANRPGEGHVHLKLDLQPVVIWNTADPYRYENVPPGDHQVMVSLVNNDHSALSPPVMKMLRVRTTGVMTNAAAGGAPLPSTGGPWPPLAGVIALLALGATALVGGLTVRRRNPCEEKK